MPHSAQRERLFTACVESQSDAMYRVAFRLTGRADQAQDLVQETFLQAWQGIASLRDERQMRGWLFGILRNQYTKHLRNRPDVLSLAGTDVPSKSVDPTATEDTDPREAALRFALAKLEPKYKLPLLLVAMEGLSAEEAAGILDVPRGTILSRMHRGRKRIRETLSRQSDASQPTPQAITQPKATPKRP